MNVSIKRTTGKIKKCLSHAAMQGLRATLITLVFIWSMGGADLFFGWNTPLLPKSVHAAYSGKQLRTVEYILGGGTDATARGDNALVYAGGSWNTTKGTAGTENVILEGSGIRVANAFIDLSFAIASAVSVTNIALMIDVEGATSQGTDARVAEELSTSPFNSSGNQVGYIRSTHDVTAFFQHQSDAQWNSGLSVVAGIQIDLSGAGNRELTNAKLVITYESDFSDVAHMETKTVRFPLDSTASGDMGTRATQCAAAATCSFSYLAELPDMAANGDLLNAFVEMQGEVDSATASNFQIGHGSSSATTTFAWSEAFTDDTTVNAAWELSVANGFATGTRQQLNVLIGTVPMNVLGGELVVTYRYSSGAPRQTETVRYFMHQRTTAPGVTKNYFSTTSVTIAQSAIDMEALWYRIHIAPTAANTFTVYHKVGTSSEQSRGYAITAANPRAGDTPTIIHDMSAQKNNFYSSPTNLSGATQFSAGGAPPAIEAYLTFTWDGSTASAQTKSVQFSGAQQGVVDAANQWNNRPVIVELPERVTKTYRSAYLETAYGHSDTTSITAGTVTIGVNGSSTAITESSDGTNESYNSTYFYQIASSTVSASSTAINWIRSVFEVTQTRNTANEGFYGNIMVFTYDVDFSDTPDEIRQKHVRTLEYLLGGASDNTLRGDNALVYAGSSWNATKGTAGTHNIVIEGSGIKVLSAVLDVSFYVASAVNVNNISVFLDAEGASSQGTDARVAEELSTSPFNSSGNQVGYVRSTHDATALFQLQSDTQWNAGLSTVAAVQIDLSAAGNRALTNAKLIITYEQDYSLMAHTETKTVRFPLDSTVTGDTGTKRTQCAAAATCSFAYTANIPDATADADILDVFFEVQGEVDSGNASTLQPGIAGGAAGTAFNWQEVFADDNTVNISWSPAVGGSDFQRNTAQTLDIILGTVPMNVLGGELVVTYRYSSGAPRQTETVRYYMDQRASAPGTTKNPIATTTIAIANVGFRASNLWFRAHIAPTAANTFTVFGKVGTSTEKSNGYAITAANARAGDTPTVIYDMSADVGNFFATTTDIAGYTQYTAGGAPPGVEFFLTFTWDGNLGGPQTKSAVFSATQQGVADAANQWNNRPLVLWLPEIVAKVYRSAYLVTEYVHSDTTSITAGTVTIGINASTTAITETSDGTNESYTATYLFRVASSTFSSGAAIGWNERVFEVNQTRSTLNEGYYGNQFVVTYDADLELKVPRFFQNHFRFYADNDALLPTDAWPVGAASGLGENADITFANVPPKKGENVRLRMSVQVATTTMTASSTQFKLQFGARALAGTCAAIASWIDLGNPGSGAVWRGVSGTPLNGQSLGANPPGGAVVLSVSDRAGSYQEQNPTAVNPFSVDVGEDVEFDWIIESNNAATATPYCFRMVKSDGSLFDGYNFSPTLWTDGYSPATRNWRWYDDENNVTPADPLANENVAPTDILNDNVAKLRITVDEQNAENGVNQKFRLQYSDVSDFSSGVSDVVSTSTCASNSGFCYADAGGVDNATIPLRVLSDSSANGTHNEASSTISTFGPLASTATEFEFTVKHSGASANTTYFFRLYDVTHGRPVPLASGESYPSFTTGGTELTFTVSGLATSTVTEGITTDVASSPTETRFGKLVFGAPIEAAQRVSVSTNATHGYQLFLGARQQMLNAYNDQIPVHDGTNASPLSWSGGCPGSKSGCFGYHAGDDTLSVGSTRFLVNDTFAQFDSNAREVAYNSGPVAGETHDMVFKIEARANQTAGEYTTQLFYVVVPIF